MKVTKQNITYVINDTLDNGWKADGSVLKNSDGTISISININNGGKNVGHYSYSYSNTANMSISAIPQYFDAISDYAKTNVNDITTYFANLNSTDNVSSDSDSTVANNN